MDTVGVIGHKGRLGRRLVELGCAPIVSNLFDIENLGKEIEKNGIDTLINCAGKTDVDWCERNVIDTYLVNTFSLEKLSKIFSGYFVQISTDFVFSGNRTDTNGYSETDPTSPINTYGFSKLFAEYIVLSKFRNSLIVRTTNIYDVPFNKPNFVSWILDNVSQRKLIYVGDNLGNPTFAPHLAQGILDAVRKKMNGIVNIVGRENISRYEFACNIAKFFGYDISFVQRGVFFATAKRPLAAGLNVKKAEENGITIKSLYSGLSEFKTSYEKYFTKKEMPSV